MTTTTTATTPQTRRERFEDWAQSWTKPRIEDSISGSGYTLDTLPRFATASYDCCDHFFRFYDTIEDAAVGLADEALDDLPAGPTSAIDLDTGLMYQPRVTVQLRALCFSAEVTYGRTQRLTHSFVSREAAEDFLRRLGDTATADEITEREV